MISPSLADALRTSLCPSGAGGPKTGAAGSSSKIDFYGEAPSLVWMNAAPGCEDAVLEGLRAFYAHQNVPVAGGTSSDNSVSGEWKQ